MTVCLVNYLDIVYFGIRVFLRRKDKRGLWYTTALQRPKLLVYFGDHVFGQTHELCLILLLHCGDKRGL